MKTSTLPPSVKIKIEKIIPTITINKSEWEIRDMGNVWILSPKKK